MQIIIDSYFKTCEEKGRPFTVSGLCYDLDMTRESLLRYSKKSEFYDTVSRAKARIRLFAEESLYNKETFKGAQFSLINNHGFANKLEVDQKLVVNVGLDKQLKEGRQKVTESLQQSEKELLEEKKREILES